MTVEEPVDNSRKMEDLSVIDVSCSNGVLNTVETKVEEPVDNSWKMEDLNVIDYPWQWKQKWSPHTRGRRKMI